MNKRKKKSRRPRNWGERIAARVQPGGARGCFPLKTSEFILVLSTCARLGKVTACLLAASDRNNYAIIMILLAENIEAVGELLLFEKITGNVRSLAEMY